MSGAFMLDERWTIGGFMLNEREGCLIGESKQEACTTARLPSLAPLATGSAHDKDFRVCGSRNAAVCAAEERVAPLLAGPQCHREAVGAPCEQDAAPAHPGACAADERTQTDGGEARG